MKKELLIRIRDKILSLKVIFIQLDNEEDAYIIFETLNTRGKELTSSDLIKNYLSRMLPAANAQLDRVKLIWQEVNDKIDQAPGQVTFNTYLLHYWLSKYEYTSNNKLYYSVKKHINKDNANTFLLDLRKCANIYRAFYEPSYHKWDKQEHKIKSAIEAIDIFNIRSALPLLLAIMRRYQDDGISKKQTESLVSALEKFIFAYTSIATTQSTGGLSMMYSSLARKLNIATVEADKNAIFNEVKNSLREKYPLEEVFKTKLKQLQYTEKYTKDRNLIRYILGKYYQKQHAMTYGDYKNMTIEHLMPQDKITDDETAKKIGSLGNLLLVSSDLNTKLANKEYLEKIKILEDSGYKLEEDIRYEKKWTFECIDKRLERLAVEAYQLIWKI